MILGFYILYQNNVLVDYSSRCLLVGTCQPHTLGPKDITCSSTNDYRGVLAWLDRLEPHFRTFDNLLCQVLGVVPSFQNK